MFNTTLSTRYAITTTFVTFLTACSLLFLNACKEDEKMEICMPSSAKITGDSVVYIYDNANRLSEIQFRTVKTVTVRYLVTYSNGRVTKLTKAYPQVDAADRILDSYTLTYGNNGKPNYVIHSESPTSSFPDTTAYAHDDKGRVVKREIIRNKKVYLSTRYEYTTDNNVSKIYYVQGHSAKETLGCELLSFDNHKRFFAGSDDLTTLEIYVFNYEPSVNNVVSLRLYETPGIVYKEPLDIQLNVTYDEKGYVKSNSTYSYVTPLFVFNLMKYTCH